MYGTSKYLNYLSLSILISSFFIFANFTLGQQVSTEVIFAKSNQTLGNTRTFGLAIGDLDLDGDKDIVIANYLGPCKLWINDGNGNFSVSNQVFNVSETHDCEIGDLNGDNYPDIIFVNHASAGKVYFNNQNGSFTSGAQNIGLASHSPGTIQLYDVDGDEDLDALIYNTGGANRIWLNDGSGVFVMTDIDYGGSDCKGLQLVDFNGDSLPDLFINYRTQYNQIWMNDGFGNFSKSEQNFGTGVEAISCKDIDGDSDIDIVETGSRITTTWLNQNNSGSFVEGSSFDASGYRCDMFDADSDGDFDLITANNSNGNQLWLNDGKGNFISLGSLFGNLAVLAIGCEDIDGDEDYDVVLGQVEGTGGNSIYLNESNIVGINFNKDLELTKYELHNNYPNPFNPNTLISYQLPEYSYVNLAIYNSLGQEVKQLVNKNQLRGKYSVQFNAENFSSGVYLYKLKAGEFYSSKKMLLIK